MTDSQRWLILSLVLISAGLVYLLGPILTPFLVGILLAYMGDPLADRLEAWGTSRTWAVVVVFLSISLLWVLCLLLLLPMLGTQFEALGERLPRYLDWVETQALPWLSAYLNVDPGKDVLAEIRQAVTANWQKSGSLAAGILKQVTQSGMAMVAWLANLLLIPVVTFYLLRDWDLMIARIKALLPRNIEPRVTRWVVECDEVLGAFIKGQLLVMLILGVVYSIGLSLIGLDLALLLGMLAGLASIVPYLGVIVGVLASGIAAFMQFQELWYLVLVGLVFGVGQLLEGMVLTPWLVGDKIGLHPVAVIFAIMAGGQLFGFVGILLALPLAAVIMVLLRHLHEGYKGSALYSAEVGCLPVQPAPDTPATDTPASDRPAGDSEQPPSDAVIQATREDAGPGSEELKPEDLNPEDVKPEDVK